MRPVGRCCFWHGTPLKMRPVGRRLSTVCGVGCSVAFEDASRTPGACFWHRISLPYRKRLFFTPNASENASRTPGSLFEHGTHIPYHRRPSPVPNVRHRGRLPPQRSLANILVDLLCATGLAAVSINPLQALAVGFHAMVLNRASTLPINSAMPRSPFILSRSALRLLTLYLFNKHNRARIAKKRLPNPPQGKPAPATHPRLFHHNGKGTVNPKITICNNYFFRDGVYDEQKSD